MCHCSVIWHIAITNVHLNLASHPLGTQRRLSEAGSHTEKKDAPIFPGEQDGRKLRMWHIHNVNGQISLVVCIRASIMYLLNQLYWMSRITLHNYIADT